MPKIQIVHIQFTDVDLKIKSFEQEATAQLDTKELGISCLYNAELGTGFGIKFKLSLKDAEKNFHLNLVAVAHFETDSEIDVAFLKSDIVKINAPAIAFPYIRTFISNLTLNSGYNPVFLPSYNFIEMAKKKQELQTSLVRKPKRLPKSS